MLIKNTSLVFLLLVLTTNSFAQFKANVSETNLIARKKPLSFSHQPFLLLKFTPTSVLGRDNVIQYGAELAPPFGKFSFNFDYGKGVGNKWSMNKYTKANHPEQQTTLYRGEIRMYFSDWYPFYALDKKPFGRYYAIEYVQKNITQSQDTSSVNLTLPNVEPVIAIIKDQSVNLKIGKHFKIAKIFFIDGFVGIGTGWYSSRIQEVSTDEPLLRNGFSFGFPERTVGTKGLYLSKTAGFRLCLVL